MKKKELRMMKPLYATAKMLEMVRQDTGVQKEIRYMYGVIRQIKHCLFRHIKIGLL